VWGTATRADVWLLLEYAGPWGNQAFSESDLPKPVKTRLAAWLDAIPHSRLQLIKRRDPSTGPAFFVALARESTPLLVELSLNAYEDLLDLDIPSIVAGPTREKSLVRTDPLFLICTNGRRDRCCARHGVAVYQAMSLQAGQDVWQTSHLGGHRFAATAVVLPYGAMYGRISTADVAPLIKAVRAGRLYMPAYRGRSCHEPCVQAADYLLRSASGSSELDHFVLYGLEVIAPDQWRVTFTATDSTQHTLQISRHHSDTLRLESCSAQSLNPFSTYRLLEHQIHPGQ
jgi:hypothetical protein